MTLFEFLACAALVFISAFMSASEVALFTLSRFQLRDLKEKFRPAHRKIKKLLADPGGLLVTILVVNEIVNIGVSTLITDAVNRNWTVDIHFLRFLPSWSVQVLAGIFITAPVILILCEATPKAIAARGNQMVAPLTAGPLYLIYRFFKPIRLVLKRIVIVIARLISGKAPQVPKSDEAHLLREEEFMVMAEEGLREGAIRESELELIRNVFELDNTTVRDVYTPISKILTLPESTTLKGALAVLRDQKFSRIPITAPNRREVLGLVYAKDLLRAKLDPEAGAALVTEIMRKPYTVSPSTRLNTVFRKMKEQKNHMVIVQEEHGELLGVVTMDDVLEVLFEDLLYQDEETEEPIT